MIEIQRNTFSAANNLSVAPCTAEHVNIGETCSCDWIPSIHIVAPNVYECCKETFKLCYTRIQNIDK